MKKLFIFIFIIFCLITGPEKLKSDPFINPFSKITITSNTATCEKSKENGNFLITYKDNVTIKLADESTIKAGHLAITLKDTTLSHTPTESCTTEKKEAQNPLSMFEKIILKDNVKMEQKNRSVEADQIELFPEKKLCELYGNVKIRQIKGKAKDLPITAESSKAILDLNTQEISLLGDEKAPVTTTIIVEGYPTLLKKIKTKEEKKVIRREKHLAKIEERKSKR